jgi:hypothetical protein
MIAERNAVRDALGVTGKADTLEALRALLEQRDLLLADVKAAEARMFIPPAVDGAPFVPPSDIEREAKPAGIPVDHAEYPGYNVPKVAAPAPAVHASPEMSPVQWDLTPSYVRWFLATEGPAKTLARYKDRAHLLPSDVQTAIKP